MGEAAAGQLRVRRPDGTRVAVQVGGPPSAPVLLLLQGQASSHDWWTGLRGRWEDRYRTVTMDFRGTGASVESDESRAGELTTGLLAEDALAVLDDLGVAGAHVYGTSMGGRVAQVLAARHDDRVRTLALACTSPGGPRAVERGAAVRRALADPDPAAVRAEMLRLFFTPAWDDGADGSHLLGDPSMSPRDRRRHLRMSAAHDAWDLLPRIGCPTLVLHGSDDEMSPPRSGQLIAERVPGARLLLVDGGRHGFFAEMADQVDEALVELWNGVA